MADSDSNEALREDPMCWAVATEKLPDLCSFCLRSGLESGKNLLRCTKCKFLHYCDQECQKADWRSHKTECKRVEKLKSAPEHHYLEKKSPGYPNDGLRLVARIYEKMRKSREVESNGRTWEDLMSHEEEIQQNQEARTEFEDFCELFLSFMQSTIDKDLLLEIYGKVRINSFGIKDYKLQSVGVGLYLSLCRLDHSCDPNGRIVFHGKTAVVVPVKSRKFDSPIDLGKIRHSYIENLMTVDERRKMLERNYFFYCQCHGCMNEKRNRNMEAFACVRHPDCDGQAIPTRNAEEILCEKCGSSLEDTGTPKAFEHMCRQAIDKLDVPYISTEKRLELASKTATMIEGVLHENNLDRMRVLRSAYHSCVKLEKWTDALMYGEKVLKTYRNYLSSLDPWMAGFAVNLAKVSLNSQAWEEKKKEGEKEEENGEGGGGRKREEARNLLKEFRETLVLAFGSQSLAVKQLDEVLEKCH